MDRKFEVGGMIALDDMWMPSLKKLLRCILANRSYEQVRTFDPPSLPQKLNVEEATKRLLRRTLRLVPKVNHLFREEFLKPWRSMSVPNLVVIRKAAAGQRDWRYHQPF